MKMSDVFRTAGAAAAIAATCSQAQPIPAGDVGPEQAAELLKIFSVTVIDVRSPQEFAAGHLPRAKNIPLELVVQRAAEIPDRNVLLVCRSGHRAGVARDALVQAGRQPGQFWVYKGFTECVGGVCRPKP